MSTKSAQSGLFMIPKQYQRWFHDIREQEAGHIVADLLGSSYTILNIGPSWGRDYYFLTQYGKHVINLDIAPQQHLERLILADVTRCLPFQDASFDAVLLAEVLEHLVEDAAALLEVRRVLRDDGLLVVSVPFFHDRPEYHVRIHSPRSINRLLSCVGFQPVTYIERGGLISFPKAIHGVRRILRPIISEAQFNGAIIHVDLFLNHHFRWMLRHSPSFGCYLSAHKVKVDDYRAVNVYEFRH